MSITTRARSKRTPSLVGVVPPAPIAADDPHATGVSLTDAMKQTALDKKTLLTAIHNGKLPAWWPGLNAQVGFRIHPRDLEAWFFNDPSRAHTPGTGTPEGPRP